MAHESIEMQRIIQALKRFKSNISISNAWQEQVKQVRNLLKNDYTGFVNTVLDFQIHAATTKFTIETGNSTLNDNLFKWQNELLNKDINIDIPRGLRELSAQYFRERWTTSFIALRVIWEDVDFGGTDNVWTVPTKMWLVNGASIYPDGDITNLNDRKYYLDKEKKIPLENSDDESVLIRKPFGSWYDCLPVPYLIKRGVVFNGLIKQCLLNKQADVISQIIPYLLLMQAGSQKLADMGIDTNEDELKTFKETIITAIKEHDYSGDIGKLIAAINGDVKMEHFIPDLTKLMDEKIVASIDKNMLAGLGMIELQGFSNTRKEAILNPQPLVEEVKDAVADWASMLKEIMYQMLERNKEKHSRLVQNEIKVIPGTIKPFLTEGMKRLLMNIFDKGKLDFQKFAEDVMDNDSQAILDRLDKEREDKVEDRTYPRQTQNVEQYGKVSDTPPMDNDTKEKQGKKPGSPEAKNFKSEEQKIIAPYDNIDGLPDSVKEALPTAAQLIFLRAFNSAISEGESEEDAFKIAWGAVKNKFKKNSDGKWVRK